jgi:uncharacterized membrane protein YfcA
MLVMPRDPIGHTRSSAGSATPAAREDRSFADVRRQVLVFSVLGSLAILIAAAVFEPRGIDSARAAAGRLLRLTQTGADVGWTQAPILVVVGAMAGFLAGMLGMGGGVLKISFMLLLLRMDIFFARAISIVTMFLSSSAALWHHKRQDLINWGYAAPMVLLALPGVLLGSWVGNRLGGSSLTHVFGFFMVFLAFNTLALVFSDPDEHVMAREFREKPEGSQGYLCSTIGALHGFVSGLLGISGGVIATPLQQIMLHMPTRPAIANTLLVSSVATAVASVYVLWTGVERGDFTLYQVFFVDFFMGAGAAVGAVIGAGLGRRCNVTLLRLLFVLLALLAGVSIIF